MSYIKRQSSAVLTPDGRAEVMYIGRYTDQNIGLNNVLPGTAFLFTTNIYLHPTFEHSVSVNPERITVKKSGIYRFSSEMAALGGGAGVSDCFFFVRNISNGAYYSFTQVLYGYEPALNQAEGVSRYTYVSDLIFLTANQVISFNILGATLMNTISFSGQYLGARP